MTSNERRLPIDSVAKRLSGLNACERVAEYARQNESLLATLLFEGYGRLIERFNSLNPDDEILVIMPGVRRLKEALHGRPLPGIMEISPREILNGLNNAAPLMELGQQIRLGEVAGTAGNVASAIGTPSMETSDLALATGTIGHLLERSIIAHEEAEVDKLVAAGAQREAIGHSWQKDDVLLALEEIVVLRHAEAVTGVGQDSQLFALITSPNSQGGLGWRNRNQVERFVEAYKDYQRLI